METPTTEEAQEPVPPRNLREELLQDLSTKFAAELDTDGSLPVAAREALAMVLNADTRSPSEIIAAASKCDPTDEEVSNE